MTLPVAAFIQLPADTANTGKKRRTQTRIVGSDTVHEDYVILTSKRSILGNFFSVLTPTLLPLTSQNGISDGALWLYNPLASLRKVVIKKINCQVQFTALSADNSTGDLRISRFSYTGTGSGANIPVPNVDLTGIAASAICTSAMTGLTISIASAIASWFLPGMSTPSGSYLPASYEWKAAAEEEEIVLAPGQGICIHNAAVLTTTNRKITAAVCFAEIE